jgi:hypothetical protein
LEGAVTSGRGHPDSLNAAILEGIRRIEDLATGKVKGLTEEEY